MDEVEVEEEGIAELMMDENAIADVASEWQRLANGTETCHMHMFCCYSGPGTSLKRPATTASKGTNQGIRLSMAHFIVISHSILA